MEDKSLESLSDAKEKKPYVKPLLLVHGNLDKITQSCSGEPDDGSCMGFDACACVS